MRKSLLKTIAATAIVGVTMALSSVAAWAETATFKITDAVKDGATLTENLTIDNITYHFKSSNSKYVVADKTIGDENFTAGINTGGKTSSSDNCCYLSFTLTEDTDITVYYAAAEKTKSVNIGLSTKITDTLANFIDSVEVPASNTGGSKTFSATGITKSTNYYICLNNGKATIYGVKLTPRHFLLDSIRVKGTDTYVICKIKKSDVTKVSGDVGYAGKNTLAKIANVTSAAHKSSYVYNSINVGDEELVAANDDYYYVAFKVTGVLSGEKYVKTFAGTAASAVQTKTVE